MNKYHYQETLIINVDVYAKSKQDAQDKVASALGIVLGSIDSLHSKEEDIRDYSLDTISVEVSDADDE
jgi:predicted XRE-type DNA-binding protein